MTTQTCLTRIVIVDDHPIVRSGLRELLQQAGDITVCGEAGDSDTALKVIEETKPDFAIIDLSLGYASGFDLIDDIRKRFNNSIRILILSMHEESLYAERALRAGAHGYIMKQEASDKVVEAIRRINGGDIYLSNTMKDKLLHRIIGKATPSTGKPLDLLSNRELDVLRLVGKGLGTKEIAAELNLSTKTVETYYARMKEKLNISNVRELIHFAIQHTQNGAK